MWIRNIVRALVIVVGAGSFATSTPASAQETARIRAPENKAEWMRFVSGRLQRFSGSVVRFSRQNGIFGDYSITIGFDVQPDGSVSNVRLVKSSGYKLVDDVALQIPARAAPFPIFTGDMPAVAKSIVVPLVFVE